MKVEKVEWSPGKWGLAMDLASAVLAMADETTLVSHRHYHKKNDAQSVDEQATLNHSAAGSMPDTLPDPTRK